MPTVRTSPVYAFPKLRFTGNLHRLGVRSQNPIDKQSQSLTSSQIRMLLHVTRTLIQVSRSRNKVRPNVPGY